MQEWSEQSSASAASKDVMMIDAVSVDATICIERSGSVLGGALSRRTQSMDVMFLLDDAD